MHTQNVYTRSRNVARKLAPIVSTIRTRDKSLADQLRRAAQSVVLNIANEVAYLAARVRIGATQIPLSDFLSEAGGRAKKVEKASGATIV